MKRVGIVGGLGPETSCSFCLEINRRVRKLKGCQPDIVMENVALPKHVESRAIKYGPCDELLLLLKRAVIHLNMAGCDFIVIPCNTVHVFIDVLRDISLVPIVSIIELCADECERRGIRNVGLLATTTAVKQKLHARELERRGIGVVMPSEQDTVSEVILRLLDGQACGRDKQTLHEIALHLKSAGAEAVILGCTDLDILMDGCIKGLPSIDTTKILEDYVVRMLS